MIRRPPRSTRTDTLLPYTTLFRSGEQLAIGAHDVGFRIDLDLRHVAVMHHVLLGDLATALHGDQRPLQPECLCNAGIETSLAHKSEDRKSTRLNSSH